MSERAAGDPGPNDRGRHASRPPAECIHGLTPAWCSICLHSDRPPELDLALTGRWDTNRRRKVGP